MIDDVLSEVAVKQVFEGIQQSASNSCEQEAMAIAKTNKYADDNNDEGVDDDDELAFSEFIDGLVAITAYRYPDPFVSFHDRVDTFVLEIFTALRKHWSRKRISPQVDVMLNALQKKLRGGA